MAVRRMATSVTEWPIGPGVSKWASSGTMWSRLIRPWLGRSATTPLARAGSVNEPEVSEPTLTGARPAATDTAEPELEPSGS